MAGSHRGSRWHLPTRPALDSLMTSPHLARTADNLRSGPRPGPLTGWPWPHTPRGLDPGGGSEAGPLSAPAPGPCLPTAAVRAARTWPARVLGAMLHPGTCQTPGDGLATRSARSWGAWGPQGPRGPTACRSSKTVTPGPPVAGFPHNLPPHVLFSCPNRQQRAEGFWVTAGTFAVTRRRARPPR